MGKLPTNEGVQWFLWENHREMGHIFAACYDCQRGFPVFLGPAGHPGGQRLCRRYLWDFPALFAGGGFLQDPAGLLHGAGEHHIKIVKINTHTIIIIIILIIINK